MQTVQCRALILANGNNLRVCDDMVRRTLRIRLNIQDVSSPRNYTQPSLKDYLITHRDEVINNVLVIVKAWQDDGCCRSKTAFSSFETWDFYCRQPLLWLTSVDPLQRTLEAIDRQFSEIHQTNHPIEYQIFDSLYQIFHSSAFSVSDISRHITEELLNRLIKNSLATKEGEVNTRKLGHWLRHNSGKQIQGLKLGAIDSYKKVKKYTIEKVIYESNH